jgi:2-methylcitrate dehydratase
MDETVMRLVDFTSAFSYDDLPTEAIAAAKQRVVDAVGCAIGGSFSPPTHVARRVAYPVTRGGARIWGSLVSTTPESAAFVNGVALRYLDYNDTYRAKDGTHPSDNIGALVACAEARHAGGRNLIAGVAVSYEIQARFADGIPFNSLGWDQPTAGVVAAALGCGKILGLRPEQLAHAVSLAIVPNMAMHQTRVGELSWWKGCAAAMGGRQGLFAARLAAAGMEGPHDPFEGRNGVWAQIGGRYELGHLGGPVWGVQQSNIKSWPVRDSCQLPIDTARALLRDGIIIADIERVEVRTYASAYAGAVADRELWAPKTRETADHSMPVSIAMTLVDGAVTPEMFERRRFSDADVAALIERMTIEVDEEFNSEAPARRNCSIDAMLTSGERRSAHLVLTQEDIEKGKPVEATNEKFRRLAERYLLPGQLAAILDVLWRLEELDDVTALVDLLYV